MVLALETELKCCYNWFKLHLLLCVNMLKLYLFLDFMLRFSQRLDKY